MTREELIVKVAVAIYDGDGARDGAIKAIDIVLEEAAKLAEATTSYDDNLHKSVGAHTTGQRIAAAIRALEENT